MTLEWKILYGDGSTFSNLDGEPWEAPKENVQAVFRKEEITGVTTEPSDAGYWIWKDDCWFGVDLAGYWDYRFHHMAPQTAVYGRYIRDEQWETKIRELIQEEMGTVKSAWRKRERTP